MDPANPAVDDLSETWSMPMSLQDYCVREAASPYRHEYYDDRMVRMGGGTGAHALISANIVGEARHHLKRSPCSVFTSDLRVHPRLTTNRFYPDVSIACPPEYAKDENGDYTMLNPKYIAEVLSPSTVQVDRGVKLRSYKTIETLEEYMLVDSRAVRVEIHRRAGNDWTIHTWTAMSDTVRLESIDLDLPMAEIYLDVDTASFT
jgi:Uma2 family endonuclease